MDTNSTVNISEEDLEIECDNAQEAFSEFKRIGSTIRRCLKCNGQFHFYEVGSSYKVWCENNDFDMTSRGV
jgi:hypothetical protein